MNTFTKENTLDATHLMIFSNYDGLIEFNNDRNKSFLNSSGFWMAANLGVNRKLGSNITKIVLSRPIGERKEDHTIDGVVTYALQPSRHIDLAIAADAINDVVISPDEPVIEPWIADQLTEAPTIGSVCVVTMKPNGISHTGTLKYLSEAYLIMDIDGFEQHFFAASWVIKPIDNRSDEDKLHDAVWESTELRARDGAAGVVGRLLSSDKFTITLKE